MVTKETTKKRASTVSKKETAKKTSGGKTEMHNLVHASGEYCFWTTDGRIIANLIELRDAFASMSDHVFKHHVTKDKNDFAEWVQDILLDKQLAKSLRSAKKQSSAKTAVVQRLKYYSI